MPRVSVWFFFVAVIYALIGMIWGEYMAMTHDHSLFPAHAHLNLLGWVSMAIYGTFYALARDRVSMRLAWVQFAVSNLGLLAMIPLVAWLLATGDESLLSCGRYCRSHHHPRPVAVRRVGAAGAAPRVVRAMVGA